MHSKKKAVVLTVCAVMLSLVSVGSTIAYLSSVDALTNTFSAGSVAVSLTETDTGKDEDGDPLTNTYVMDLSDVDGIIKDPRVSIVAGTADCWLFVQLQESTVPRLDDYLDYTLAEGWEALPGVPGVYYRHVPGSGEGLSFSVIADNALTVKSGVDQEDLDKLKDTGWPTLTVTAYAMQSAGFEDAASAWAQLQDEMAVQA